MTTLYNIDNVLSFKGFVVYQGQVQVDEDSFNEMIDDCSDVVSIMGLTYNASKVLDNCDPVAYRCAKADYESSIQTDLKHALDNEDYDDIVWDCDPDDTDDAE